MGRRRAVLAMLFLPLLSIACGGGGATAVPPTAVITQATATVAPAAASPTSAATAPRAATAPPAASATSAPSAVASRAASPTSATPSTVATVARTATTATRVASSTAGTPAATARTGQAPLGAVPAGWKVYAGRPTVPFAIAYPPDWTVDESRVNEGRVYFYAPGVTQPYDDAEWVLIATSGRAEPNGNIDVLRDQYFASEIRGSHPEAGVDITRNNTFSGIVFASIGATFNSNTQLSYAYIGLGLRGGVPWRFRLNSSYEEYDNNLETVFAPMINSLNIYGNP